MKTLYLIVIGFFCFLSTYGAKSRYVYEYEYDTIDLSDVFITDYNWESDATSPFDTDPFLSDLEKAGIMTASGLDDETELGGLERPTASVGGGMSVLLLLSVGYCFKCYRSLSKTKK